MSDLPIDWKLDIAAALALAARRATAAVKEPFGHAVAVASTLDLRLARPVEVTPGLSRWRERETGTRWPEKRIAGQSGLGKVMCVSLLSNRTGVHQS
jgi:hypothetical protein